MCMCKCTGMYVHGGGLDSLSPLCGRLVCERTVEENILKKANQKRLLGDIAIEGGGFTTEFFKEVCDLYRSCKVNACGINRSAFRSNVLQLSITYFSVMVVGMGLKLAT